MENKPVLTFVIVVKSDYRNLLQTINSIDITQQNIQVVVKDYGGCENTKSFMKNLSSKNQNITYIVRKDDGIYDAMNQAIEYSCGSYINFINCGDTLISDSQEILINILKYSKPKIAKFLVEVEGGITRLERASIIYFTRRMLNHQGLVYDSRLLQVDNFNKGLKICGDLYHILSNSNWKKIIYFDLKIIKYLGGGLASKQSSIKLNWIERLCFIKSKKIPLKYSATIFLVSIGGLFYWYLKNRVLKLFERKK